MLTKEDYENYLNQIKELEENMIGIYEELTGRIEEKDLKKLFNDLMEEEKIHSGMVTGLRELII